MPTEILEKLKGLRAGVVESLKKDPRYLTLMALDKSIAEIGGVLVAAGLVTPDAVKTPPALAFDPTPDAAAAAPAKVGLLDAGADDTEAPAEAEADDGDEDGDDEDEDPETRSAEADEGDDEPTTAEAGDDEDEGDPDTADASPTEADAVGEAEATEVAASEDAEAEAEDVDDSDAGDTDVGDDTGDDGDADTGDADADDADDADDAPAVEVAAPTDRASATTRTRDPKSDAAAMRTGEPMAVDAAAETAAPMAVAAMPVGADPTARVLPEGRSSGYRAMASAPGAAVYQPGMSVKYGKLPNRVDLRSLMTPVEDQGRTNSCVANAVAGAWEYWIKRATRKETDVSRLFVYYNARWRGGSQDKDEGSVIQLAMESLAKFGACSEKAWPFDRRLILKKPGSDAYRDAAAHRVHDMARVPLQLEAWKQALAEGKPIVFGCALFASFDDCNRRGGVVPMPSPKDLARAAHGGHAMCAVGYNEAERVFIVRNSWGRNWGDKGYCYMPYDYLLNPKFNFGDCWVFVPKVPLVPPREVWSDDDAPVTNDGKGVDFVISPYSILDYVEITIDLFADEVVPFTTTVDREFLDFVGFVERSEWSRIERFDVETYLETTEITETTETTETTEETVEEVEDEDTEDDTTDEGVEEDETEDGDEEESEEAEDGDDDEEESEEDETEDGDDEGESEEDESEDDDEEESEEDEADDGDDEEDSEEDETEDGDDEGESEEDESEDDDEEESEEDESEDDGDDEEESEEDETEDGDDEGESEEDETEDDGDGEEESEEDEAEDGDDGEEED